MKPRVLLAVFLLLGLVLAPRASAQQIEDYKQASIVASAHYMTLTIRELNELTYKAELGDKEAQFWVGSILADGHLVPKDLAEATRWWLRSVRQGYPPAYREYGLTFLRENPPEAERWLQRAAVQGDTEAQLLLGIAYEQDWFGSVDSQEAIKWYRKAAERDDPDAQVALGQKYENGEGLEQSYALAAEWYRKAAEHVPDLGGAGQGRNRLGLLYLQGLGVSQDYAEAYFWFSLNPLGTNADEAKSHLNDEQIREAERRVSEWKEQHPLPPEVAAALRTESLSR